MVGSSRVCLVELGCLFLIKSNYEERHAKRTLAVALREALRREKKWRGEKGERRGKGEMERPELVWTPVESVYYTTVREQLQ